MNTPQVLVINEPFIPDFCRTQRWAAKTRARVMRPPDWLAYATAVLEQAGIHVELHDFPARGWDKADLERMVAERQPRLVVLDATTPSIYSDIDCARLCKKAAPGCAVIMVGPHVSARAEETLDEAGGAVDAIAVGEFELTVRDYALNRLNGAHAPADIPGLVFRDLDGAIHRTATRPPIEELDALPFPAWSHLVITDYFDGIKLHPFIDVIGGRGCPFTCNFCIWPQVMHGHRYRLRSVENVVAEMAWAWEKWPEVHAGEFFFEDDTFTADHRRIRDFCNLLIARNHRFTWSANARADINDLELLQLMKRAGCRMLVVGFESGDQGMLDRMGKKIRLERMVRFTRLARQAGIKLHGCFVLGLPGETRQSMEKTRAFALENPLDTVQFSGAAPFPGARYFDEVEAAGLLRAKRWDQWLQGEGEQIPVVDLPGLSQTEVEAFVDDSLMAFYFRPGYLIRFLLSTRSRADLYRKLRGGWNFLGYLFKRERRAAPAASSASPHPDG